jgi:hypothetical protein
MRRELEQLTRQQLEDLQRRWEDSASQPSETSKIAEMIRETRPTLDQAADNQQRLGNRDEAERLRQISESLEQAREAIDQAPQQRGHAQPAEPIESSDASSDPNAATESGAAAAADQRGTVDATEKIQTAIDEAAEQLESLLQGSAMETPPEDGAADSQPQTQATSEQGAADSQPPTQAPREEHPTPPPADSPEMSRAIAKELAEAMQQLDAPPGERPDNRPAGPDSQGADAMPKPKPAAAPSQSPTASQQSGDSDGAMPLNSALAPGSPQSSDSPSRERKTSQSEGSEPSAAEPSPMRPADRVANAMADAIRAASQQAAAERAGGFGPRGAAGQSRSLGGPTAGNPTAGNRGYAAIGSGAKLVDDSRLRGPLPRIDQMSEEDWAKLPPQIARDLLDGRREKVSPEYRRAIETYFRLVAETAVEETEQGR